MTSDQDIAFPRLSRSQVDALGRWGHVRPIVAGDVLFKDGDRDVSFYAVLEDVGRVKQTASKALSL